MADKPVYTSAQIVAQLTRLGVWATPADPIAYAFLVQRPLYMGPGPFAPFTAAQRAGAEKAFALVAEVCGLTFVEVPDNGLEPGPGNRRLTFHTVAVDQLFSGSTDYYQLAGSKLIDGADILLNTTGMNERIATEGFFNWPPYVTLHEVLHAVGLSHPGDYNGAGFNYGDHALFYQDTRQYSVMSYWAASHTGADHFIGSVHHVAQTPLLYDILALQKLYGANHATRAGDTVYGFNSNTGVSPFNFAHNPAPIIAIWDGGGRDRLDFSGFAGNSLIDLNAGAFSSGGGLTKNVAIAFGAVIEDARGGGGADTLIGNAAANRLDGGGGADTMHGRGGDDVYIVDHASDRAIEASADGGIDHVVASVSFTLGAHVEKLTLTGAALAATGNALANVLVGTAAANRLDGRGGADTMVGGAGDDTYHVDHAGDRVVERSSSGVDLVAAAVSYVLPDHVEKLRLVGSAVEGVGNAMANGIAGTDAANRLDGRGGADSMAGRGGDDVYVVDHAGDRVVETRGADGVDTVLSSVSFTLPLYVERLTLTGGRIIDGTGNGHANVITGNIAANRLDGAGGADTLKGGRGHDTLNGGDGNDLLFGGQGRDTLSGGAGRDRFHFDTALDPRYVDRLLDFVPADDSIMLSRAVFTGLAASGTLSPSAFRRGSSALDADDRILYDQGTGRIFYDADGVGGAAAVLFAQVNPGTALTHADFIGYI